MAPQSQDTSRTNLMRVDDKNVPSQKSVSPAEMSGGLNLFRKVRLSAALLSNDVAAVFEQLYMLPVLQALGTPVALLTISGSISATIAIGALPLCGWLTDGGSNPRKRKRPALVGATFVMVVGLGLILTGNAVHLWGRTETNAVFTEKLSANITKSLSSNGTINQDGATDFPLYNVTTSAEEIDNALDDPLGIGVPLLALTAMAGFVLLDVGYDLTNANAKTFMLSVTTPVDHVSLLVTGVLMSALGGCLAALTGIWDLASILGITSNMDAVSSMAVVQLIFIISLTFLCTICSLTSAPSDTNSSDSTGVPAISTGARTEVEVVDLDMSTATLQTDVQESIILATASPIDVLGLSTSTQVERNHDTYSISMRLGRPHLPAGDRIKLLEKKAAASYRAVQRLESDDKRKQQERKKTWNLVVICLATFFIGGSLFFFILSATDYVAKVLYGGDPEAPPSSSEHAQYELGLRTGSLGMFIMNVAYLAFSLVHRRVLGVLGPKGEFLVVSVLVCGVLLALQLTDQLGVYYVTSAIMGLNRAVLYTVPFMLANQHCQPEGSGTSQMEKGNHGHGKVGSIMALVTCALPCAFLVVCTVTGPLIDATGDPGAPMMVSIVFSAISAITFACYRS